MTGARLAAIVGLTGFLAACGTGTTSGVGPVVVGDGLFASAFRAPTVTQTDADRVLADLLASDVGEGLSEQDRRAAATALQGALAAGRAGEAVEWRNRSSGVAGRVVTGPSYQVNSTLCRDYTHFVTIGGRETSLRGAACRSDDAGWQPIT